MSKPGLVAVLASCLVLAACGGKEERSQGTTPPPAREADLLEELRVKLQDESEFVDDAWVRTVAEAAFLLWPDETPEALALRRDHTNLALIAGNVSVQLFVAGPGGRAGYGTREATSLAMHDAFRQALTKGPDAYRLWVAGEGRALLKRRVEALQAR